MITITVWLTEPDESGYKYLVRRGPDPYAAYKTKRGFIDFMDRCGLVIDKETTQLKKGSYKGKRSIGKHKYIYDENLRILTMACKPRKIMETCFGTLNEVPESAVPFRGLSNGSYVTCYYEKTDDYTIIYHPNPNNNEIYDALDLNAHIAFSKQNG